MTKPLILYDIPGLASPSRVWTPNPLKARLVLTIKGLPHETVWVEYPDIAPLCKKINAEPTSYENGKPEFTLPVLQDPNTGAVVSESFKTAQYLDETYLFTIKVIPDGTEAFQTMFLDVFHQKVMRPLFHTVVASIVEQLAPPSQEYFRRTREEGFKKKIEEIAPEGPVQDERWREFLAGLSTIHGWISAGKGGEQQLFVMGDVLNFADVVLIAHLVWLRIMRGIDSKEWKDVMQADGGRWKRLMDRAEEWVWVDKPDVLI